MDAGTVTMREVDDRALVREFVDSKSASAFEELVRRNAGMVYSAARRQVIEPQLAEDVTQAVFLVLAQKASTIKGLVAGWLMGVTYNACRNAKRIAARRDFHERRAGMMKLAEAQLESEIRWEDYAPLVDAAMNRLGHGDRDLIAMRYLRGSSLKDVGTSLGISEEAARKRVDRAIGRLRGLMSEQAAVPAVAVVGSHLLANGMQAVPAGLIGQIAGLLAGGAKGTAASAIAGKTARAMTMVKIKLAAAILIAIAVTGAAVETAIELVKEGSTVQPVLPLPTPAVASPQAAVVTDAPELSVPGTIQIARWDVFVNDQTATALRAVTQPVQTKSVFYSALTGNGARIRKVVADAIPTGGLIQASNDLVIAADSSQMGNIPKGEMAFGFNSQLSLSMFEGQAVQFSLFSQDMNGRVVVVDENKLHLIVNDPKANIQFAEYVTRRNLRSMNRLPRAAIEFHGDLSTGDAVAMLGRYIGPSRKAYNHLIVWETFHAAQNQKPTMGSQTSSQWWCVNGPRKLREWADAARVWAAQDASNAQIETSSSMSQNLSDGKKIWLVRLSRPARWPGCWWDAHGQPTNWMGGVTFQGDPPGGLWFYVALQGDTREMALEEPGRPNTQNGVPEDATCYFADTHQEVDGTTRLKIGAPVGPWEEAAGLKIGEKLRIDGVEFSTERIDEPNSQQVNLTENGVLNNAYYLIAVDKLGKESSDYGIYDSRWAKYANVNSAEERIVSFNFSSVKLPNLAYLKLMRRKREFVTFDGFATQPAVTPKTQVTTAEADAAEKDREHRVAEAQFAQAQEKRKAWEAIAVDLKTPEGFTRAVMAAAQRGDAATVRKYLTAHDPQVNKLLDEMAQLLILNQSIRSKAIELFGIETVDTQFGQQPLMVDVESAMMQFQWKPAADGKSYRVPYTDSYVLRKGADGNLYVDCDGMLDSGRTAILGMQIYCTTLISRGEQVDALMKREKPPTLDELKASMANIPAPPG